MTNKDMFKGVNYDSLEKQVGGKHYKDMKIQPAEFINENKLLVCGRQCYKVYLSAFDKGKRGRCEEGNTLFRNDS
jgi:hypothetical protein